MADELVSILPSCFTRLTLNALGSTVPPRPFAFRFACFGFLVDLEFLRAFAVAHSDCVYVSGGSFVAVPRTMMARCRSSLIGVTHRVPSPLWEEVNWKEGGLEFLSHDE